MKRKITDILIAWKDNPKRKPLIINGARQVGKTYIIKKFGEDYFDNVVYINFETNLSVGDFFEDDISPQRIIRFLEVMADTKIVAGKSLIIFDEIQASNRALTSLKVFFEEAPEYHIIAAGSLLGVAVNREKFSFPVGKVSQINMYPLDFEEFIWALKKEALSNEIRSHFETLNEMPSPLHAQAIEYFKYYLIVGGMPEAVQDFANTQSFMNVVEIQSNISTQYLADMSKYAETAMSVKIRACYNSIPAQLAKENKKFQYKIVQKGGTASIFGEAIEWLHSAGIILPCQKIDHGFIPISAYVDLSDFKMYMSDTGLLTQKSGMPIQTILSEIEADNIFLGALYENFVAQSLTANEIPLYYWKNENTAEVDFVIQQGENVIPVEVKKGNRTRSISMRMFATKYQSPYSIRISKKNFGFENGIKSIPHYATFCITI